MKKQNLTFMYNYYISALSYNAPLHQFQYTLFAAPSPVRLPPPPPPSPTA